MSDDLERAAADPHRPRFHFTAPAAWLNDPNGVCQRDDGFHLFYQYNPTAPVHGHIQWGHALSGDLVHWEDRPVALVPSPGPDAEGCWSGVLVESPEGPVVVYSGHNPRAVPTQTCCLAHPASTGDMDHWVRDPRSPVIAAAPTGLDVLQMRDHCVWRDERGTWHQVMGAGLRGRGGALLHYTAPDLQQWEFRGTFLVDDERLEGGVFPGTTWECPDLFALRADSGLEAGGTTPLARGDDVFVFSAWDEGRTVQTVYLTGDREEERFVPCAPARLLDYGLRHYYAPQSFRSRDGRRLQFGWIQEARPQEALDRAGSSGAMSLPRVLARGGDGSVTARPAREVLSLRRGVAEEVSVHEGGATVLGTCGNQLDLEASVVLAPGGSVYLDVLATPDGEERTRLVLARSSDGGHARMRLDRSRTRVPDLADGYDERPLGGPLPVGVAGEVDVRVLVDHSVVEVFANGHPLTARAYPSRTDVARGVAVGASGTGTCVDVLRAWTVTSAEQHDRQLLPEVLPGS